MITNNTQEKIEENDTFVYTFYLRTPGNFEVQLQFPQTDLSNEGQHNLFRYSLPYEK